MRREDIEVNMIMTVTLEMIGEGTKMRREGTLHKSMTLLEVATILKDFRPLMMLMDFVDHLPNR